MTLTKQVKQQIVLSSILLFIIGLFGVLGTFFLFETIYLFLVETSAQADVHLMNKILRYFTLYKGFHIVIIGISFISIILCGYLLYRVKRNFKVGYFIISGNVVAIILTLFLNRRVLSIMKLATQQIKSAEDINLLYAQGKDFVSVIAVATQNTVASVTQVVLKGLAIEIFVLVIYLLIFIVLILRTLELRKQK